MSYEESWNRPHQPGEETNWQESDCYWFFDSEARVGGYHRLGQYVNQGTGQAMIFAFKEGGQCFRRQSEHTGNECSRDESGQKVGSHWVKSPGNDRILYGWDEPESAAELEFYEHFYKPRSWVDEEAHESGAVVEEAFSSGHLEAAGRLKGRIRIGDEEYTIDALAHRDRSWGPRDYSQVRQGRQFAGTVGKQLSWNITVGQMDNGTVFKAGFVARDGKTTDVKDAQFLVTVDYDIFTTSDVRVQMLLADDSKVELSGQAIQGYLSEHEGLLTASHTHCEVVYQGARGFTSMDSSFGLKEGMQAPSEKFLSLTRARDGLQDAADYSVFRW